MRLAPNYPLTIRNDVAGTVRDVLTTYTRDGLISRLAWMVNQVPEENGIQASVHLTADSVTLHVFATGWISLVLDETRQTISRLVFHDDEGGGLQIWTA